MDLSRPVAYRDVDLNDAVLDAALKKIIGNKLLTVRFAPVQGVGYKEKRALADGFDASDVYLGLRQFVARGRTYGENKGDAFDRFEVVRVALTPTAAYADDPGAQGYLPWDFWVPTNDIANFPAGERHMKINVRPGDQPGMLFDSGDINTDPSAGYAIDWEGVLEAIDPTFYAYTETNVNVPATANPSVGATNWTNRGNYKAPLNLLLSVAAGASAGAKFHFEGGGSNFDIALDSTALAQTFRYDSRRKLITQEVAGAEMYRLDLLTFNAQTTHPLVERGISTYLYQVTGATIAAGSRFWFNEAWA